MRKIFTSLTLCLILLFSVGCGQKFDMSSYDYQKQSTETLLFSSSDPDLDFFLNDYFKRHIGYVDSENNDMQVTSVKPGKTNEIFYHEWEALSLYWFNSFAGLESNRIDFSRKRLSSVPVDNYGYVWQTDDTVRNAEEDLSAAYHSMGWPFPNSNASNGNSRSWDFNGKDSGEEWTSNFGAIQEKGLFTGKVTQGLSSIEFVSPALRGWDTILSYHAPLLEFDLRMLTTDNNNVEDVYIWFKNSANESWSESKRIALKDVGFLNYKFTPTYEHILYVPMYAHPSWNSNANNEIAQIKVEIKAKEGKKLTGKYSLNYMRPIYDTRHSNNNAILISSLKTDYEFTGDIDFLKDNVVRARKAMNFLMQMYDQTRGLNRQSYLVGHEGDRSGNKTGKSLGNGYWDILFLPEYDFHSNLYFYKALKSMIFIENVLEQNNINVSTELSTVKTANRECEYSVSLYNYTVRQLESVANRVLTELRKEANDSTRQGFFDAQKGRFIAGYDKSGVKVDYGYTMWNLEAVYLGVANDDQSQLIMSWINGDRIIETDRNGTVGNGSVGEDIYAYEFAPRCTTVNETGSFYWVYHDNKIFGKDQIQFGGADMFVSYYDLISRIEVLGADNAFTRLKKIQSWYDKIYAYSVTERGASARNFYREYYAEQGILMQGMGTGGIVGLDSEFIESILTVSAVPLGFFGLSSENGKTLTISPSMPNNLDYWKIENLAFNFVKYDLTIANGAVQIDSVRGNANGLKVKVYLDKPANDFKVYVDGVQTDVYGTENEKIVVEVPLQSTKIQVK